MPEADIKAQEYSRPLSAVLGVWTQTANFVTQQKMLVNCAHWFCNNLRLVKNNLASKDK